MGEEIGGGAIKRPIVGGVVAASEETVRFGGVMSGVKKIVRGEEKRKRGTRKGGMIGLGSFGKVWCGEPIADFWREFFVEMVSADDAADVGDGGWIGKGGAGGESGFLAVRNVGDGDCEFGGICGGDGEASTFDGRSVFADGVDFVDGRAAGNEELIEVTGVVEGLVWIERRFHQGGAAAGDQENDERTLRRRAK